MDRSDFIQAIINKFNYQNYLEIGCRWNETFDKIQILNKVGVDPEMGGTHRMTSDDFFNQNEQKFDIIFIDGLHISDQVDKDITNSLKFLNKNGTIVLHDCNPPREDTQRQYMVSSEWCGDVWKSLVRHREYDDLDIAVGDFDYGCGVIRRRNNSQKLYISGDLIWDNLAANKQRWLRLMPFDQIMDWIAYEEKNDFSVSILVPVLNRPQNINNLITSYLNNSPLDKTNMVFITSDDCKEEIEEIKKYNVKLIIAPDDCISWAKRINYGIQYTNGDKQPSSHILCGADDIIFHPRWFDNAERLKYLLGIIGTNDLGNQRTILGYHSTHPIVHRDYVRIFGTIDEKNRLCHEGYIHNFVDDEIIKTAVVRNSYIHCSDCIIEHNHPAWNKAKWDDIYQIGNNSWQHDQILWESRKKLF